MVSRVLSLFRFRSRCLIRISVAPFALRRLIRPFAALPLPHATPRSLSRVCVVKPNFRPSVHVVIHSSTRRSHSVPSASREHRSALRVLQSSCTVHRSSSPCSCAPAVSWPGLLCTQAIRHRLPRVRRTSIWTPGAATATCARLIRESIDSRCHEHRLRWRNRCLRHIRGHTMHGCSWRCWCNELSTRRTAADRPTRTCTVGHIVISPTGRVSGRLPHVHSTRVTLNSDGAVDP
jgi:hypothetical protein